MTAIGWARGVAVDDKLDKGFYESGLKGAAKSFIKYSVREACIKAAEFTSLANHKYPVKFVCTFAGNFISYASSAEQSGMKDLLYKSSVAGVGSLAADYVRKFGLDEAAEKEYKGMGVWERELQFLPRNILHSAVLGVVKEISKSSWSSDEQELIKTGIHELFHNRTPYEINESCDASYWNILPQVADSF